MTHIPITVPPTHTQALSYHTKGAHFRQSADKDPTVGTVIWFNSRKTEESHTENRGLTNTTKQETCCTSFHCHKEFLILLSQPLGTMIAGTEVTNKRVARLVVFLAFTDTWCFFFHSHWFWSVRDTEEQSGLMHSHGRALESKETWGLSPPGPRSIGGAHEWGVSSALMRCLCVWGRAEKGRAGRMNALYVPGKQMQSPGTLLCFSTCIAMGKYITMC